ncbi:M20/M25/M40 family metallo-hydrolase [Mycolicibacterium conceptionense]|uniref:M20/M25/M40 family metallo-hydrolase n=1 Tax=Mycolicibacterium conceptionense TaxID=451644 RepID=UPI002286A276|nr:M20/M25/M40 family metallo-hydrolase [Mycolicibacterium conceptionense]
MGQAGDHRDRYRHHAHRQVVEHLDPARASQDQHAGGAGRRCPRASGALTRHLETHAPWGARVTVVPGDVGQPYAIDSSGPVYDAARSAFRTAWGTDAIDMGMGGSIPFIAEFAEAFPDATILVTGVEDPGTQAHSINESLHLGVLEKAAMAEALLLEKLGQSDR